MLKQRIICILGLFTAIFPFFGIPLSWKKIILFVMGLGIFAIGYLLYRERRDYLAKLRNRSQAFSEQRPEIHAAAMPVTPVRKRRVAKPRVEQVVEEPQTEEAVETQEETPVVSRTYPYQQSEYTSHE